MTDTNVLDDQKLKDILEPYVASLMMQWVASEVDKNTRLHAITNYLLSCVDQLIAFVEPLIQSGPDKKIVVLNACLKLFDYAASGVLPLWMKPFAGSIRYVIVSVIISNLIDFMVNKYRDGSWKLANAFKTGKITPCAEVKLQV